MTIQKPQKKTRCSGGCDGRAYHLHEMTDGTWSICFDDMDQETGFATWDEAHAVMRSHTHPKPPGACL